MERQQITIEVRPIPSEPVDFHTVDIRSTHMKMQVSSEAPVFILFVQPAERARAIEQLEAAAQALRAAP